MSFSTYLSFSSLYEIEQSSSPAISRCNSLSSEDGYAPRGAKAVGNNGGVLRRDSNCSTSTKSSTDSSSSADFDKRVHFASSSSSSSSSSSASSVYQSHSERLHSHSKRYSTEDGSLPSANLQFANEEQDLSLRRFGRR